MRDSRSVSLLGNPRTIGLVAFLLSIPIGIIATFTATHDPFGSVRDVMAWLAIGVLAQLALGVALLIGNFVLVRRDFTALSTRLWVIVVAVIAGAMRGVAVAFLPGIWGLTTTASVPVRILSSAIIFTFWLVILGASLGANDRYRESVNDLVEELATHELQLRLVDSEQGEHQAIQTTARIAESTAPIATALAMGTGVSDHARLARLVQDAIEERLRPLSHEFWFERSPVIEAPRSFGTFLRRVVGTPIPWRRALPLMTVLLIGNSLVRWGWPTGFYSGAVASVLVALVVVLCTFAGRTNRLPWNIAMYVLLLLFPAPAAVATVEWSTGQEQRASVNFLMALGVPLAFLLGAAANAVVTNRRATLQELRASIAQPTWDAHLGELHRRQIESDAAAFLHNTVQARLLAASLQLEQAAAVGDQERADEALQQARDALEMASTTNTFPLGPPPRERFEQIEVAWQGIAKVTIEAPDVLEPDAVWRTAAEAVEECVTNAVRHGHATRVDVSCRQSPDAIEITVDDDGGGAADSEGGGLGRSWLSSVTGGKWSLTTSQTGAKVALRIAT